MRVRAASHAGSWYDSNPRKLRDELIGHLEQTERKAHAKALIVPHAGYAYSGYTAAWSYRQIDPTKVNHVFVLGPSHKVYLAECALPEVEAYETPLGRLKLDVDILSKLKSTGQFRIMSKQIDEDEHSIEMQLPYLAHVFRERLDEVTFIPVMVGSLDKNYLELYSTVFEQYLSRDDTLFVISSDFCHWGSRFQYQRYKPLVKGEPIHEAIERLDKEGVKHIEQKDGDGFYHYLKETKNTICGRNPISLFLATLAESEKSGKLSTKVELLFYDQSDRINSMRGSSVSYVSALCSLN